MITWRRFRRLSVLRTKSQAEQSPKAYECTRAREEIPGSCTKENKNGKASCAANGSLLTLPAGTGRGVASELNRRRGRV